jgi:alginate O-acetyltransferase complex protein AlgI
VLFSTEIFWLFFVSLYLAILLVRLVLKNVAANNMLLLAASYYFYGYWDVKFLSLIFLVSAQTYILAKLIRKSQSDVRKSVFLTLSVGLNIGVLFAFKYYDFFLVELFHIIGKTEPSGLLHLVLPVGISFYIFQSLTYVIDTKNDEIYHEPTLIEYFTYVAFFPQLVAGPIERARKLLPQFQNIPSVNVDMLLRSFSLISLGLFLKLVIADSLSPLVDHIFGNYKSLEGGELVLGIIYFSIQIYCDFCGYSTIAIGVALSMGYRLSVNFKTPYLSTSVTNFWRRWHVSLSTFFRDYVYIPLGGSRGTMGTYISATMITFVLSGIWHGAGTGFMMWGFLHGLFVILEKITPSMKSLSNNMFLEGVRWFRTMTLVGVAWVFFRLETVAESFEYLSRLGSNLSVPVSFRSGLVAVVVLIVIDIFMRKDPLLVNLEEGQPRFVWLIFSIMLAVSISFMMFAETKNDFIYFQF